MNCLEPSEPECRCCDECIEFQNEKFRRSSYRQDYQSPPSSENKRNQGYHEGLACSTRSENLSNGQQKFSKHLQNGCDKKQWVDTNTQNDLSSLRERAWKFMETSDGTRTPEEDDCIPCTREKESCPCDTPTKNKAHNINYEPQSNFLKKMTGRNDMMRDDNTCSVAPCGYANYCPKMNYMPEDPHSGFMLPGNYYTAQTIPPSGQYVSERGLEYSDASSSHGTCTCYRTWRPKSPEEECPDDVDLLKEYNDLCREFLQYQEAFEDENDLCDDDDDDDDDEEVEEHIPQKGKGKSKHVSRCDRRSRRRSKRCNAASVTSNKPGEPSEHDFEPSLKKPHPNSCDRCWRYASPSRSPVNKPSQRFDPNYRKSHSDMNLNADGKRKEAPVFDGCESKTNSTYDERETKVHQLMYPTAYSPCAFGLALRGTKSSEDAKRESGSNYFVTDQYSDLSRLRSSSKIRRDGAGGGAGATIGGAGGTAAADGGRKGGNAVDGYNIGGAGGGRGGTGGGWGGAGTDATRRSGSAVGGRGGFANDSDNGGAAVRHGRYNSARDIDGAPVGRNIDSFAVGGRGIDRGANDGRGTGGGAAGSRGVDREAVGSRGTNGRRRSSGGAAGSRGVDREAVGGRGTNGRRSTGGGAAGSRGVDREIVGGRGITGGTASGIDRGANVGRNTGGGPAGSYSVDGGAAGGRGANGRRRSSGGATGSRGADREAVGGRGTNGRRSTGGGAAGSRGVDRETVGGRGTSGGPASGIDRGANDSRGTGGAAADDGRGGSGGGTYHARSVDGATVRHAGYDDSRIISDATKSGRGIGSMGGGHGISIADGGYGIDGYEGGRGGYDEGRGIGSMGGGHGVSSADGGYGIDGYDGGRGGYKEGRGIGSMGGGHGISVADGGYGIGGRDSGRDGYDEGRSSGGSDGGRSVVGGGGASGTSGRGAGWQSQSKMGDSSVKKPQLRGDGQSLIVSFDDRSQKKGGPVQSSPSMFDKSCQKPVEKPVAIRRPSMCENDYSGTKLRKVLKSKNAVGSQTLTSNLKSGRMRAQSFDKEVRFPCTNEIFPCTNETPRGMSTCAKQPGSKPQSASEIHHRPDCSHCQKAYDSSWSGSRERSDAAASPRCICKFVCRQQDGTWSERPRHGSDKIIRPEATCSARRLASCQPCRRNSPSSPRRSSRECPGNWDSVSANAESQGKKCVCRNHRSPQTKQTKNCCRSAERQNNPRKYCVFYMNKAKPNRAQDIEVLIEELTQEKSNKSTEEEALKEKMKKMKEVRGDSMALRFQKGITETSHRPQSDDLY